MEYAKDIVYNLKFDKMVNRNKSWTSKLKSKVKNNTIKILVTFFLISFISIDIFLILKFINILKLL